MMWPSVTGWRAHPVLSWEYFGLWVKMLALLWWAAVALNNKACRTVTVLQASSLCHLYLASHICYTVYTVYTV